jgi:hypothetical protein
MRSISEPNLFGLMFETYQINVVEEKREPSR